MNGIAFLRGGGGEMSERWGVHLERILLLLTCAWKVWYSDLGWRTLGVTWPDLCFLADVLGPGRMGQRGMPASGTLLAALHLAEWQTWP